MHTVVIVDDDKIIRKELRGFLECNQFKVVAEAQNGIEGLSAIKEYIPDLITLDIEMPEMDGLSMLKEVLEYKPDAKVVMISAIRDRDKVNRAMALGAFSYIQKPLRLNDSEFTTDILGEFEDAVK